jgi:hypothetical protein
MGMMAHDQELNQRSDGSATIGQPPMVYGHPGHRNYRSPDASSLSAHAREFGSMR